MMHFLLVFFVLKICIYFISGWLYFCLYVFNIITINMFTVKFMFIRMLTFSDILVCFFYSLLSLIVKDIVLMLSKCSSYPIIWGSFTFKVFMTLALLYPMKYLVDLFVAYGFFLKPIFCQHQGRRSRIFFCFYKNYSYWFLLSSKVMLFPLILTLCEKR